MRGFDIFRWQAVALWGGLAAAIGGFYLAVAAFGFGVIGFPLDDAWIHQTYARNLAHTGQMAFVPGLPSAGSTAPLWSGLLSLGYLFQIPFRLWSYGLGLLCLALTGWTVARLGRRLFPRRRWAGLMGGLFCLLEWHLVWAAVSGMETILFVWLSLFLFKRYLAVAGEGDSSLRAYGGLGLIGGMLALTRPEGMGLLGLIGLDMIRRAGGKQLLSRWAAISIGAGLLLLPYMLFHLWLTGLPLPNTLYAKQAEYAVVLQTYPWWWRLFGNLGPPVETVQGVFRVVFIGPQLLLWPGLIYGLWLTIKERRAELGVAWLWWISYLLLYGFQLPVTYQHGRYQIPAIPWLVWLGVWGTIRLVEALTRRGLLWRVTGRALALALPVLIAAFAVIGARAYGRDVRFIETEMVATARWLDQHAAPEALIAAHDIGAIGYFTGRPLLDLAGLITPEVIPFIRDEAALLEFMAVRRADYLVTFPTWYPDLVRRSGLNLIYPPQPDPDRMSVYRIMLHQNN